MTDAEVDGLHPAAPGRTIGAVFWHVVVRLGVGALGLMFIALLFGACLVAYQDLAGPHCDGHRMGPADTCSVLTSRGYRSIRTIEKLNPAGTDPAVLTAPVNWHATGKCPAGRVLAGRHARFSPHHRLRHVGGRVTDRTGTGLMGV